MLTFKIPIDIVKQPSQYVRASPQTCRHRPFAITAQLVSARHILPPRSRSTGPCRDL